LIDMVIICVFLALSCLFVLGSSRLAVAIRVVAAQGLLLGLLPIVRAEGHAHLAIWILGLSSIVCKGIILPWLMTICLRQSSTSKEIRPFVGFGMSIICGILLLGLSMWLTSRLRPEKSEASSIALTTAMFLVLVGLFLMVTRRQAITQSLAYLVMENGVYAVGVSMNLEFPFIVELGILLDVFVGVFLMGNLLFHIDHEFDHLDVDKLTALSDDLTPSESSAEEHA
jgi:hydrogenase-4 component E